MGCLDDGTGQITIHNDSSAFTSDDVYIVLDSDTNWGSDQLSGSIPSKGSESVIQTAPNTYDIRVTDSWGDSYSEYSVYLGNQETVDLRYDGFSLEIGSAGIGLLRNLDADDLDPAKLQAEQSLAEEVSD